VTTAAAGASPALATPPVFGPPATATAPKAGFGGWANDWPAARKKVMAARRSFIDRKLRAYPTGCTLKHAR
jgi:hypothetical protein